jgi:valyl-tRNA synthetase
MTATDQRKELPKAYEPTQVEQRIYDFWLQKGYFSPSIDPDKKPFVIIMPPPNVTGELHVGHALTAALEDIITRWHRMKGEPTLWLPGVDHAGIATQVVVERQLAEQGTDRHELGRDSVSPVTGAGNDSPWMRGQFSLYELHSSICTTKG